MALATGKGAVRQQSPRPCLLPLSLLHPSHSPSTPTLPIISNVLLELQDLSTSISSDLTSHYG